MKHTLKHYFQLGMLLLGITFCLFTCEPEVAEAPTTIVNTVLPPQFRASFTSSKELLQKNSNALKDLQPYLSANVQSKSAEDNNYGFSIDTTQIRQIETASYISYTFNVIRSTEVTGTLENYIITYYNNGTHQQHLISYPVMEYNNNTTYDIANATGTILHGDTLFTAKNDTNCLEFAQYADPVCIEYDCNDFGGNGDGSHNNGQACDNGEVQSGTRCTPGGFMLADCGGNNDVDPPPGSTTDYNGGNSGDGGDGSIPNNDNNEDEDSDEDSFDDPLVVIPLEFNEQEDPCEQLKNLVKTDSLSANIKPLVEDLRDLTSENNEYSVNFRKKFNYGQEYSQAQPEGIVQGKDKNTSPLLTGSFSFGQIHSHPEGTKGMFSWRDVYSLYEVFRDLRPEFKNEAFIMIVNHDGSVYNLKVTNFTALSNIIEDKLNNTRGDTIDEKIDRLNSKMESRFNISPDNIEGIFLKYFNSFGISLYKATDQTLDNWDMLELENPNNSYSDVELTPCN